MTHATATIPEADEALTEAALAADQAAAMLRRTADPRAAHVHRIAATLAGLLRPVGRATSTVSPDRPTVRA